jgi:hypothetical protein
MNILATCNMEYRIKLELSIFLASHYLDNLRLEYQVESWLGAQVHVHISTSDISKVWST